MSRLKTKLGYEDYAAIDDGQRYELIDGELCMVPAPNPDHQLVSKRILKALDDHVASHNLGVVIYAPLDVILGDRDVVQPDLLFIAKEHRHRLDKRVGMRGAPDLVIEILSPGNARRDRIEKSALYHRYGVREMWIVDPEAETIEVFLPGAQGFEQSGCYRGDQAVRSAVLPDLALCAAEAFAE